MRMYFLKRCLVLWRRWGRAAVRHGPVVCAAAYSAYLLAWAPGAFWHWAGRADVRRQARQAAALTYEDVAGDSARYAGRIVRWHALRRGSDWYYRGDPAKPIHWVGNPPDLHTGERHSVVFIAGIAGRDEGAVRLTYRGIDEVPFLTALLRF